MQTERNLQNDMIICRDLSKSYGSRQIFSDVNCCFADTGFYLLLGESGSGKTTFLNILAGLSSFEKGTICWNNQVYREQVRKKKVEYITQDSYFVDFLTVMDNLRILGTEDQEIQRRIEQMGLSGKEKQYPGTLSGGERQRLAMARALLNGGKIFLLDEPTASLDEQNKKTLFEMFVSLSRDILIICASHDPEAAAYADVVLKFSKDSSARVCAVKSYPVKMENRKITGNKTEIGVGSRLPAPRSYLKKWFCSGKREKRSQIYFAVFIAASLIICSFADVFEHKNDVTSDLLYHVNSLHVSTAGGNTWDDISPSEEGIIEAVLDYSASCPDGIEYTDDVLTYDLPDYELSFYVLPFRENAFILSDKILYGTYFTGDKQIILSAEMAEFMAGEHPEKLLGNTLERNLYGIGTVELEIVGILDHLTEFDRMYLSSIGVDVAAGSEYDSSFCQDLYFINNALLQPLESDRDFFMGSEKQRGYQLYFDSYKSARTYEEKYGDMLRKNGSRIEIKGMALDQELVWPVLSRILLPLAFLTMIFSILFYIQLRKTEFIYNSSFVSVFEYAGYSKETIIRELIRLNLWELVKIILLSTAGAGVITLVINALNRHFYLLPYQIFTWNPWITAAYYILLISMSVCSMNLNFRRVKTRTWYENLIGTRDLL